MKIRKIVLLSAAMLLSAAVSAQVEDDYAKYGLNDGITHRYPAFKFTANVATHGKTESLTFIMPAWDAIVGTEPQPGLGTGYRIALMETPINKETPAEARIVSQRGFSLENTEGTGSRWFASNPGTITIYKPNGDTLKNVTASTVTYGDIFGADTPEPATKPFTVSKTQSSSDNLTIQGLRLVGGTNMWAGYQFKIVEIGECAFRNANPTTTSGINFSAIEGTVTIPNTIRKIENNAFRHGVFKKVVFEEGSTVETIEAATFEGCINLEEVILPANLTKIEGTAFGGCKNLKKLVFTGSKPELTTVDEEPLYPNYDGPYNIFQSIKRQSETYDGNVDPANCLVSVNEGLVGNFRSDAIWNDFYFTAPAVKIAENRNMATFCSEYNFATEALGEESGLRAYCVKEQDIKLTSVDTTRIEGNIARGEGVLFGGEGGKTYNLYYPPTTTEVAELEDNCLHGVLEPTDISEIYDEEMPTYVLYNGEFHLSKTGTLAAGKAYLQIYGQESGGGLEPASRSTFSVGHSTEPTAIESALETGTAETTVYDLQGRIVKTPTKGLYIVNGKKMMVK